MKYKIGVLVTVILLISSVTITLLIAENKNSANQLAEKNLTISRINDEKVNLGNKLYDVMTNRNTSQVKNDTSKQIEQKTVTENSNLQSLKLFSGKIISNTDYVYGNKESSVIVIEYADPECPFCIQFGPTIKQVRAEYKDKIAFVYRSFPLAQIHPNALVESQAIECAGKIGAVNGYYNYINNFFDYKFDNQTTKLPSTGKEDLTTKSGINFATFNSCLKNKETEQIINNSINDGIEAGVQGTPTTFVLLKDGNNYRIVSTIDGARPYSFIKAAIEEALNFK